MAASLPPPLVYCEKCRAYCRAPATATQRTRAVEGYLRAYAIDADQFHAALDAIYCPQCKQIGVIDAAEYDWAEVAGAGVTEWIYPSGHTRLHLFGHLEPGEA